MKITGNRYDYLIQLVPRKRGSTFEIISWYKEDNSQSSITNVNAVIGEIISPFIESDEVEDSSIDTSRKIGKQLFDNAVDAFGSNNWLLYLEDDLDEDKELGGWNTEA